MKMRWMNINVVKAVTDADIVKYRDIDSLCVTFASMIHEFAPHLPDYLAVAAEVGNESLVRFLFDRGVRSDLAVGLAAEMGNESIVRFLVENGVDVNAHDGYALRFALLFGDDSLVKFLIDNGANNYDEALMWVQDKLSEDILIIGRE